MGGNSIFSRPSGSGDDDLGASDDVATDPPEPPRGVGKAEGVRVIDASEAAEVVERGDAVRRKRGEEPRLGDRPEEPPADRRPAIRFPLGAGDDPSAIDRPRPLGSEPRLSSVSDHTDQHPVISIGSPTGEAELPHWTSSATGEIPRVVIGENDPEIDDQAWSTYATVGPRWRDQSGEGWDEPSFADLAADLAGDDSLNVGALAVTPTVAEDEGLTHDEYLGFDDLDMPDAAPPQADLSRISARGTAADPIRIGTGDYVAPSPVSDAGRGGVARSRLGASVGAGPGSTTSGGRDIRAAVQYGLGMVAVAILCFWFGKVTTTALVAVVLFVSIGEFCSAVKKLGFAPLAPVALAATAALTVGAYAKGEAAVPLVLFATLLVGAVWHILGIAEEHPLANLGITLLGVVYVGVFGSFATLILRLDDLPEHPGEHGVGILLVAVAGAVLYDVGGLFGGRQFGRRPLSKASPNKTVEGLLSGCAASVLGVLVFGIIWSPLGVSQLLVLGLACALAAPIGDLTESVMKRDLGIKDFSDLIPGHGGVLDRFDSLLFVLPTTYYVVRALLGV